MQNIKEKYPIVGIQLPGENGITADGVQFIMEKNSGYEFDFRRIDGDQSAAVFVIDSDIYTEMDGRKKLDTFDRLIRNILNDTANESPDSVYDFFGYKIWFGYEPEHTSAVH